MVSTVVSAQTKANKADAMVAKREVASQVATETTLSERQLIEASAKVTVKVMPKTGSWLIIVTFRL